MTSALPRVSTILQEAGLKDSAGLAFFTREALDRGTAMHMATAFLEDKDLDWNTVHPSVLPRVRQYQRWRDEMGERLEILAVEEEVVNRTLGYVGHVDRRVIINGVEGVLDLKSIARAPWHAIQLSLYAGCYVRPMARWNLYLSDDAYQLVQHRDPMDWTVAKAAITIAAWRRHHVA